MTTETKASLKQINDVSRQLLSCIQSVRTSLQSSHSPQGNIEDLPENTELPKLVSERQTLITHLFEHNTAEELNSEAKLLQVMLTLDSELTTNSTLSKQELAEQVVKLKKSRKVKKSYQKY